MDKTTKTTAQGAIDRMYARMRALEEKYEPLSEEAKAMFNQFRRATEGPNPPVAGGEGDGCTEAIEAREWAERAPTNAVGQADPHDELIFDGQGESAAPSSAVEEVRAWLDVMWPSGWDDTWDVPKKILDLARRLEEAAREAEHFKSVHAKCCVAMIPYVPSFGYLSDAIKKLGERAEELQRRLEKSEWERLRAGELVEILNALTVGQSFLHHSHGRAAARTLKPKKFTSHPDKKLAMTPRPTPLTVYGYIDGKACFIEKEVRQFERDRAELMILLGAMLDLTDSYALESRIVDAARALLARLTSPSRP